MPGWWTVIAPMVVWTLVQDGAAIDRALSNDSSYAAAAVFANGFQEAGVVDGVLIGTHRSGGLSELEKTDGRRFEVDSAFLPAIGHWAQLRADFVVEEAPSTVSSLHLSIDAQVSNEWGRYMKIFAYNWQLQKYEYIDTVLISRIHKGSRVGEIKDGASQYISKDGDVRIVARSGVFSCVRGRSSPKSFTLGLDRFRLLVVTHVG